MSSDGNEPSDPTPIERIEAADGELAKLSDILTRLWLERHLLYGAIRDVKTLRHNLELSVAAKFEGHAIEMFEGPPVKTDPQADRPRRARR